MDKAGASITVKGEPLILAESSNFILTCLIECKDREPSIREELLGILREILLNSKNPYDLADRIKRVELLTLLYGGILLFYKSDHFGPIIIGRTQIHGSFNIKENLASSRSVKGGDKELLELWARLSLRGDLSLLTGEGFPVEASPQGTCRFAPTGFVALL
jgi:hypothetical protein